LKLTPLPTKANEGGGTFGRLLEGECVVEDTCSRLQINGIDEDLHFDPSLDYSSRIKIKEDVVLEEASISTPGLEHGVNVVSWIA
jgi:hypothetical protein